MCVCVAVHPVLIVASFSGNRHIVGGVSLPLPLVQSFSGGNNALNVMSAKRSDARAISFGEKQIIIGIIFIKLWK